ncbi:MAG: hypothetical protein IT162_08805 [Bryobacterales bacterium]|nr:hypothetical protein [Bryobacterales bacterium]
MKPTSPLPWLARLASLPLLFFFLAMLAGEGPPAPWRLSRRELLYLAGLAALYGGLAAAWFRPAWGGAASLAGWAGLSLLAGRPAFDAPLSLPALVALLYLACGSARPAARPRWVTPILYGPLPVLLLLAANEIFGHPPLLARPAQSAEELAGAWAGPGPATLYLDRYGRLTGSLWQTRVDAQLRPNRTRFGRLLGWRSDYAAHTAGRTVYLIDQAAPNRWRVYDAASGRSVLLQR